MSHDLSGAGPGRAREFLFGGAASGMANLVSGVAAWVWMSRGEGSVPDDGAESWLTAVLLFAFVVAFGAVVAAQPRSLAWGVVAGSAAAVVLHLTWLFLAILWQSA